MVHVSKEQINYYSLSDDIDNLSEIQDFKPMLKWWRGLCDGKAIPYKSDVDFKDLIGWHSNLILSEFTDHNQDYSFRIIGENIQKILGRNIKVGSHFSEIPHIEIKSRESHPSIMGTGKKISYYRGGSNIRNREFVNLSAMAFPLADKSGECSHLITFFKMQS